MGRTCCVQSSECQKQFLTLEFSCIELLTKIYQHSTETISLFLRARFKVSNHFFDRQLVSAVQVSTHCGPHVHAPQKLVNLGALQKRRLQLRGVKNWSKMLSDGTKKLLTWRKGVSKIRKKLSTLFIDGSLLNLVEQKDFGLTS